jgi:sarcosine oxidase
MMDADVIVVGLGAFGAMAAWRLDSPGMKVLGFELYTIGHDQGKSH